MKTSRMLSRITKNARSMYTIDAMCVCVCGSDDDGGGIVHKYTHYIRLVANKSYSS